jgi:sterol desaturase/sphingolipid hydroxylase (fatty acid hydroxylase superfamily)
MRDTLFAYEPLIRLGAFGGVFVVMAMWEFLTPRRPQAVGRNWRWPNNLGVVAVDALLVRVLLPITTVGLALVAEARGVGLFNIIALPMWVTITASVILLDLAIYLQHVLFHAVPALWRLHRMHHADLEVDVTTGLRFHPLKFCCRPGSSSPSSQHSGRPRRPC